VRGLLSSQRTLLGDPGITLADWSTQFQERAKPADPAAFRARALTTRRTRCWWTARRARRWRRATPTGSARVSTS
jgi:hypothetical protein